VRKLLYRAQFLQDQLTETAGNAPDLMRNNLTVLEEIAIALRAHGDIDGAIAVAQRSVTIAGRLVTAAPRDIARARELAESHERLGDILLGAGRRDDALAAFASAATVREKLATENPGNKELQDELAKGRQKLAAAKG
jgi:hypothetical protein